MGRELLLLRLVRRLSLTEGSFAVGSHVCGQVGNLRVPQHGCWCRRHRIWLIRIHNWVKVNKKLIKFVVLFGALPSLSLNFNYIQVSNDYF